MLGEGELKLSCYAVTAFFQLPCFELHILNCDHRGISDERLESSMKAGQILICMKSNFKLETFFWKRGGYKAQKPTSIHKPRVLNIKLL